MSFNFSNKPLVSIACIAYNQSNYIQEALDGFLMQKTNFPIEIIIHDDASTDGTAEIIRKYEEKFPDIIKPIYQVENQYTKGEGIMIPFVYPKCNGKYIALCEGDDYWTDPYKLQKQVDFLEVNEEYGLVHTNYKVVGQNQNSVFKYKRGLLSGDMFEKILKYQYNIVTATVLFRTSVYKSIECEYSKMKFQMGDLPLWLTLSHVSKFKYLEDVTTTYRVLCNSVSHPDDIEKLISFRLNTVAIRQYFSSKYNVEFNKKNALSCVYAQIIKDAYIKKNNLIAVQYYIKMIRANLLSLFNPVPLLFLLGTRFFLVNKLICYLYKF
jgi:glycosyltransferase involved in cell wall biosynthesis